MSNQLLLIELNEVNFEFIEAYCRRGALPNLQSLIERYGYERTSSEQCYQELEPWIQWVTAHTGLSFSEHGVFRLGDVVQKDIPQIWELLEQQGFRVGAISPMNAKHRLKGPAFFVPDPWTRTELTARVPLKALYNALSQAVNDNATSRITAGSVLGLLVGLAAYSRPCNYREYFRLIMSARKRPWRKAMLLDLLLADVFITEVGRTRPDFATIFLNAAAHIQHHYMYCAKVYSGPHRNPEWYVDRASDPVLEVYSLYDQIIAQIQQTFPRARIMLATGLHQDPHDELTFYWRLRNHQNALKRLEVPYQSVEPRMSRDFLVRCRSEAEAHEAAKRLSSIRAEDGLDFFEVDNRGTDLFVMLTYPREIKPGFAVQIQDRIYRDFDKEVAFVALKNGQHNGTGYFLDTGGGKLSTSSEFPLTELPHLVARAFGISLPRPRTAA